MPARSSKSVAQRSGAGPRSVRFDAPFSGAIFPLFGVFDPCSDPNLSRFLAAGNSVHKAMKPLVISSLGEADRGSIGGISLKTGSSRDPFAPDCAHRHQPSDFTEIPISVGPRQMVWAGQRLVAHRIVRPDRETRSVPNEAPDGSEYLAKSVRWCHSRRVGPAMQTSPCPRDDSQSAAMPTHPNEDPRRRGGDLQIGSCRVERTDHPNPSARRCSVPSFGRSAVIAGRWAESSIGWRPSRIAVVMSGRRSPSTARSGRRAGRLRCAPCGPPRRRTTAPSRSTSRAPSRVRGCRRAGIRRSGFTNSAKTAEPTEEKTRSLTATRPTHHLRGRAVLGEKPGAVLGGNRPTGIDP